MDEELNRLEREYFQSQRAVRSAKGLQFAANNLLLDMKALESKALDALHAHQDKMNESLLKDWHLNG